MKLSQIAAVAALSLTASFASASVMAPQNSAVNQPSAWNNKVPAKPRRIMQGGPVRRPAHVQQARGFIPAGHGVVMPKAPTKQSDLLQRIAGDLGSSKNSLSQNNLLRQPQYSQPPVDLFGS